MAVSGQGRGPVLTSPLTTATVPGGNFQSMTLALACALRTQLLCCLALPGAPSMFLYRRAACLPVVLEKRNRNIFSYHDYHNYTLENVSYHLTDENKIILHWSILCDGQHRSLFNANNAYIFCINNKFYYVVLIFKNFEVSLAFIFTCHHKQVKLLTSMSMTQQNRFMKYSSTLCIIKLDLTFT